MKNFKDNYYIIIHNPKSMTKNNPFVTGTQTLAFKYIRI